MQPSPSSSPPPPPPPPGPCTKPLDVLFLVDSSASIGDHNYKKMGEGMATIVKDGLKISQKQVNVAAWTFSGPFDSHKGFDFTQYLTDAGVEGAISSLHYDSGSTATGEAISWTLKQQWPKARSNVKHAMIIVTDGKPQDDVRRPSEDARNQGIKMFAIGVGGTYNLQSLQEMASQPYKDYVYTLQDFELAKVTKELIKIACDNTTAIM